MSVAAPAKFTFDLDLGKKKEQSRVIDEQELADMLAAAEQQGYDRGYAEAETSVASKSAEASAKAIDNLASRAAKIAQKADQAQRELLTDATQLAVTTARKLAANLIARHPLAEITDLMDECLASLGSVPHLVIRCHPDLADLVKEKAEQKMHTSGFEGRLVVLGEPDITLGDARLEWVDGGLVRDLNEINGEIDRLLAEYTKANGVQNAGENNR